MPLGAPSHPRPTTATVASGSAAHGRAREPGATSHKPMGRRRADRRPSESGYGPATTAQAIRPEGFAAGPNAETPGGRMNLNPPSLTTTTIGPKPSWLYGNPSRTHWP